MRILTRGKMDLVARSLDYAASHEPCLTILAVDSKGKEPSIQEVWDRIQSLSPNRPIRRDHEIDTLQRGYNSLSAWGVVDANQPYSNLPRYLGFP